MQTDPKMPIFFVYYCTTQGDVLGKLMFTNREMIFEPLNENLKGFYNYSLGNFEDNSKMGFIISYADVCQRPIKVSSPDPESNSKTLSLARDSTEIELLYHVYIELSDTGYGYTTSNKQSQKFKLLRDNDRPIASFAIKINRKTLTNEINTNQQRELIAEKIKAYILKGSHDIKEVPVLQRSYTNISCFDINF